MPAADAIAANLAFINWTVLTGLAIGAVATVAFLRLRTAATRGFLGFTAACGVVFGLLALASDGALPGLIVGSPVEIDGAFDALRRVALVAFCVLAAVSVIVLARGGRATVPLGAATAAGAATLVLGGLAWGGGIAPGLVLALQLAVLALATGGVFAAMILGHWYLVTTKLPEAPLVLVARGLFAVVALQLVLFAVWLALGAGPGAAGPDGADGPFAALVGPYALFVWLRLLVGLLFPLVVSWAAIQTARTRSMESATGLLYVNVGTVAAGTILAAGLYFGAGLLV